MKICCNLNYNHQQRYSTSQKRSQSRREDDLSILSEYLEDSSSVDSMTREYALAIQ